MEWAAKSNHRFRHAAFVMKGGAVLSYGYNHNNCHAEVNALKKLWPSKRKGCSVFVIRLTGSGMLLAESKPCEECQKYMRKHGVKRCSYSTADRSIATMKI